MKIQVKMFALARQAADSETVDLDLPEGATVGDLRSALQEAFPLLADMGERLLISVDAEYAGNDLTLTSGAEVACIPPVSGG